MGKINDEIFLYVLRDPDSSKGNAMGFQGLKSLHLGKGKNASELLGENKCFV